MVPTPTEVEEDNQEGEPPKDGQEDQDVEVEEMQIEEEVREETVTLTETSEEVILEEMMTAWLAQDQDQELDLQELIQQGAEPTVQTVEFC